MASLTLGADLLTRAHQSLHTVPRDGTISAPPPPPPVIADQSTPDFQRLADVLTRIYTTSPDTSVAPTPVVVNPDPGAQDSGTPAISWAKVGLWVLVLGGGYALYRWWRRHHQAR